MKNGVPCFLLIFIQCISIISGDTNNIKVSLEEFNEVANALNFQGKVVLVTGSSSGIGATTARLFAKLGANVVITGRHPPRITQVASDCRKLSPKRLLPLGVIADLTAPGSAARLVNETIAAFSKIDVLVNTAGIFDISIISDPNYNQIFAKVQATNRETIAAYAASKSAVVTLTKVLANELGPDVRVNVVSPGIVDGTRIFRNTNPSPRAKYLANSINYTSRKRFSVPMDIAKVIVFLASNLSVSLDGQELYADQGAFIAA